MLGLWMRNLHFIFLVCTGVGTMAFAQPIPPDFMLRASAGGLAPWSQVATITIDSHGHGTYTLYTAGGADPILAESTFTVSLSSVQQLWQAIQDSNFFSLASPPANSNVFDGSFAKVTVTANGASHQVLIRNTALSKIQFLIGLLNQINPPSLQINYTPPTQLNIVPRDPCTPPAGSVGSNAGKMSNPAKSLDPKERSLATLYSITGEVVVPHPGTVVAYNKLLSQVVANKTATLKSKGRYFGDDVSISVDNRIPMPSDTITITLFLEFWGPRANLTNVYTVTDDINSKWSGHTTSDGKVVRISIVARVHPDAIQPPCTPGYHQIELVAQGSIRSGVGGEITEGARNCAWEVPDQIGTFGHEAGHLMGLPDRYVDYHKQSDSSWVDANGDTYGSDSLFAKYVVEKYPGKSLDNILTHLKTMDVYSIPLDGSENDVMAAVGQPVKQDDIDWIAAHAGLLVEIPAGGVFVDKIETEQSLIVTHGEDVYVDPGGTRTLNGIYAACIDIHKSIPDSAGLFDVAPSLGSWRGIPAAAVLLQFARFMDSVGLYCGSTRAAQEAIWRITDNTRLSFGADSLLSLAGIDAGDEAFHFPRLTTRSTNDSTTFDFVPDQLIVANIQPRFADGTLGNAATFNASVYQPVGAGLKTNLTWNAIGPDSLAVPISGTGSSRSLTPLRSGVYVLSSKVTATDSALNSRSLNPSNRAYLFVPDSATETFEHANLRDRFPWTTSGNVPWSISTTSAQTGTSSVQPGPLAPNQKSVLAINLALAADSAITFSIRTASMLNVDYCQFFIDNDAIAVFNGVVDWKIVKYPIKAGAHTLSWVSQGSGVTASKVWLDNVFFPPHSIVTSAQSGQSGIPTAFVLYQNFPNPFNPTTSIRYGVPIRSHVTLTLYNTVGQLVAVLQDGEQDAGYHEVQFDGRNVASGVYFYRITAGDYTQTKKFLLIR